MKSLNQYIKPCINLILVIAIVAFAAAWAVHKFGHPNKEPAHVNFLQITTNNPPAGKSVLPEQRRIFALEFEKKFKDKGLNATVTTTGDFHTILSVKGNVVNGPLVHEMTGNNDTMQDLREMGFKHIVWSDGKVAWNVDLKN